MVHASDAVLILMGGTKFLPSHLPSKAFEYLHAAKPILAIAGEGELAELARRSGLGIVVPPRSVDAVVSALRGLLAEHAAGRLSRTPDQAYIRGFERAVLSERLARVLDAAMQSRSARP
jgi:glycosyltransferase involved in cell wall biosynthesis